jgi:hypothetical protein
MSLTDPEILDLRFRPADVGPLVAARRTALTGEPAPTIAIADAPVASLPGPAAVVRGAAVHALDAWPAPGDWQRHDRVLVVVEDDDASRARYLAWLRQLASRPLPDPVSLAPVGVADAGLHRLWCIAAARLVLPADVRIEVRHDLVGIRLAQLALGMGADILAGPLAPDRTLPLAGVTRPNETSAAGLHTLIRQAGFRPADATSVAKAAPLPPTARSQEATP